MSLELSLINIGVKRFNADLMSLFQAGLSLLDGDNAVQLRSLAKLGKPNCP